MEDALQELIKKTVVKAVIAKAVAALPFLGWWGINPIFGFLVGKLFDLAYDEIETGVRFIIIDLDSKARAKAAVEAKDELKRLLKEKGISDAETRQAEQEFDRRYDDLIKLPIDFK